MYQEFLPSSYDRAQLQGYAGARLGKMTDPTGRSAPGEINSLLIWQQPHPMYFAEIEYRSFPNNSTLHAWDEILTGVADFMASFAWYNETTGVYDLGPPMYPVSESTNPNVTVSAPVLVSKSQYFIRIKLISPHRSTRRLSWRTGDSVLTLPSSGNSDRDSRSLKSGFMYETTWLGCRLSTILTLCMRVYPTCGQTTPLRTM